MARGSYCQDCGLRAVNRGVCSNCQEELYILEYQSEYIDGPLSAEFMDEAARQQRYLRDRETEA